MSFLRRCVHLPVLVWAATAACGSPGAQQVPPADASLDTTSDAGGEVLAEAGFERRVFSILEHAGCGECHTSARRVTSHWALTTPADTYAQFVNFPGFNHCTSTGQPIDVPRPDEIRVIPGDPEGSLLMKKLTAPWEMCGLFFGHMPPGPRPRLAPEQLALIRIWIAQGAPP